VDRRIDALFPDQKTHILIDEGFHHIFNFMKSIQKVSDEMKVRTMKPNPNKIALK
jgi:hypothetical protein